MNSNHIAEIVKNTGIAQVKNFLSKEEIEKVKIAIDPFLRKKTDPQTHFPVKISSRIIKLLKLDLNKFFSTNILLKISQKKKMKKIADLIFKEESQLTMIDAYKSTISDKEVLPWHIDKAYDGVLVPNLPFHHPDSCCIKFFIYFTEVGPNNG